MLFRGIAARIFKTMPQQKSFVSNPLAMPQQKSFVSKPLVDSREYRVISLPNKLEALLISDPRADKAAAAMDVRVGSLFDPPEWQGLAHFVEHMLFLGTAKYPAEDEYQSFLAKHGGQSNAFTADTHTCYFFNVSPDHLRGAIDRFSQFFVAPLLTQSATDRELNAVHSEHSKNLQEDMWRQYQLMRTVAFHRDHPAHHFSTGNKETLGEVPRSVLLEFHQKWYSSNVSKVAVLGRESLDELERLVKDSFADVANKEVFVPFGADLATIHNSISSPPQMINPEIIGKCVSVIPVKEQRVLQFNWFLPEQTALWESKPARYLSHILGHEGPGSLTFVLKAGGFVTDLSAGLGYDGAGTSVFKLDIHLTKSGIEAAQNGGLVPEISRLVAAYVRQTRELFGESLWKEVEVVDNLGFAFKATVDPMTAVQTAANALHYYPESEVLAGPSRIYKFDELAIKQHLAKLLPDNMYVCLIGKEFAPRCDSVEEWYGTKFGISPCVEIVSEFEIIEKMTHEQFEEFVNQNGLEMPNPNPFLPENLTVIPVADSSVSVPSILTGAIFYKQDNQFLLPKGNAAFVVYRCGDFTTSNMFIESFVEKFSKIGYLAEIAGLVYKLKYTNLGVSLSIGGYSDKVGILLKQILRELTDFKVDFETFSLVKDKSIRQLKSQLLQKAPYSQAIDLGHQVLLMPYLSTAEKLDQLEKTNFEHVANMNAGTVLEGSVEGLIEGNFSVDEAKKLASAVCASVGEADTVSTVSVLALKHDLVVSRRGVNPDETNCAVAVNVETGWIAKSVCESDCADLESSALLSLLSQICSQKFFDDLRTKQQLGYIVHSAAMIQERRAGLLFLVQSELQAPVVQEKLQTFINNLDQAVSTVSEEDFQKYIQAVVADFKEKPKNQAEEFQRHWAEIEKRRFDFKRKERLIPIVETITKNQLVKFVQERVQNAPKLTTIITNEAEAVEVFSNEEIRALRTNPDTKWVPSNNKPLTTVNRSKI